MKCVLAMQMEKVVVCTPLRLMREVCVRDPNLGNISIWM